jgi:hypothetical protein
MRIRFRFLVASLLVSATMVACGGGGGGSSKVATATTAAGSTATTVDAAATTAGVSLAPAACRAAIEAFASGPAAALAGTSKTDYAQVLDSLKQVQGSAPSEIKDDLAVIVQYYAKFVTALRDAGIDFTKQETMTPAKLQKLGEAIQSIDQAKYATASQHISSYFQANCKVG